MYQTSRPSGFYTAIMPQVVIRRYKVYINLYWDMGVTKLSFMISKMSSTDSDTISRNAFYAPGKEKKIYLILPVLLPYSLKEKPLYVYKFQFHGRYHFLVARRIIFSVWLLKNVPIKLHRSNA